MYTYVYYTYVCIRVILNAAEMCQIPQNKFLIQKNQWISIFQTSNIQISKPYLEVSVIAFQENNSKLTNTYSSFASETYIPARL